MAEASHADQDWLGIMDTERSSRAETDSPDLAYETTDPAERHTMEWVFRMLSAQTRGQGEILGTLKNINDTLSRHEKHLEKISDIQIAIAKIETNYDHVSRNLEDTTTRLDKVRTYVIGAAAIVAAIIIAAQIVLRFLPPLQPSLGSQSPTTQSSPAPPRR
jgi:hypothetical protein